jgi:hypothetical protein
MEYCKRGANLNDETADDLSNWENGFRNAEKMSVLILL